MLVVVRGYLPGLLVDVHSLDLVIGIERSDVVVVVCRRRRMVPVFSAELPVGARPEAVRAWRTEIRTDGHWPMALAIGIETMDMAVVVAAVYRMTWLVRLMVQVWMTEVRMDGHWPALVIGIERSHVVVVVVAVVAEAADIGNFYSSNVVPYSERPMDHPSIPPSSHHIVVSVSCCYYCYFVSAYFSLFDLPPSLAVYDGIHFHFHFHHVDAHCCPAALGHSLVDEDQQSWASPDLLNSSYHHCIDYDLHHCSYHRYRYYFVPADLPLLESPDLLNLDPFYN